MSHKEVVHLAQAFSPKHAEIHVQPNDVPDSYQKSPSINFNVPEGKHVQAKTRAIVNLQPSSAVSNNLLDSGVIDLRCERGLISMLTHAYARIDTTNNDGAAITLAPPMLCLNKVDIYGANGNTILATYYGPELYQSLLFLNSREFDQMAGYIGVGANYATTGNVMAAGENRVYYIMLTQLLQNAKFYLGGLNSELLFRFTFESSANNLILGAALPTVNNFSMHLKGYYEPVAISKKRYELYHSPTPLLIPYINHQRMNQTLTLATSSTYEITMSGLTGIVAMVTFAVLPAAYTAATQANYVAIESIDITDNSNQSILGFLARDVATLKIDQAELFDNRLGLYKDFYPISFSSEPVRDIVTGNNMGCTVFNGFNKVRFTTTSTIVPGSYQIQIRAFTHEHLIVYQGAVSSSRA